eukprot:scaffold5310_cov114-Isochrysis_galbana.AAC.1
MAGALSARYTVAGSAAPASRFCRMNQRKACSNCSSVTDASVSTASSSLCDRRTASSSSMRIMPRSAAQ